MMQTIYADVLFIVNLIINCVILAVCSHIIGERKKIRIFLGSLFGAVYSVITFFPEFDFLKLTFLKLIFSFLIVIISFKLHSLRSFIKNILIFYAVSFAFGGAVFAVYLFSAGANFIKIRNGVPYFNISLPLLLSVSIITYILLRISYFVISKSKGRIHSLHITFNGKSCTLYALHDTGNSLTHSVSLLPVIVAEKQAVFTIISDKFVAFISGSGDTRDEYMLRFSAIPYKTVSGTSLMYCFRPDRILLDGHEIFAEIGITEQTLSSDKKYNALIGFERKT